MAQLKVDAHEAANRSAVCLSLGASFGLAGNALRPARVLQTAAASSEPSADECEARSAVSRAADSRQREGNQGCNAGSTRWARRQAGARFPATDRRKGKRVDTIVGDFHVAKTQGCKGRENARHGK